MDPADPARRRTWLSARRRIVLAGALVAAVTLAAGALAVERSARARADEALASRLAYFGFGRQTLNLPVAVERPVTPVATRPAAPAAVRSSLSREEVRAQLGFAPGAPRYVPSGYRPVEGFEVVALGPDVKRAQWRAWPASPDRLCSSAIFLHQWPGAAPSGLPFPIGAARVAEAAVGGAPGVWVEDAPVGFCAATNADGRSENKPMLAHILAWDRDGIRYRLVADPNLGFGEIATIAESLNPPSAEGWLRKMLPLGEVKPTQQTR